MVRLDIMVFTGLEPGDGSLPDATIICLCVIGW